MMKKIYIYKTISLLLVVVWGVSISSCSTEISKPSDHARPSGTSSTGNKISKIEREQYKDGITALYNNDLDKAQKIFVEFIRNKPNLAGAYSNLALVHFKKNEHIKSLKQVNKALKLNPKQAQALNLRAQLYVVEGKIHESKEDYIQAITIKPKYQNAQYNLALLYDIYLQEVPLAIEHYNIYMSLLKKPDEATAEWVSHLEGTLKND